MDASDKPPEPFVVTQVIIQDYVGSEEPIWRLEMFGLIGIWHADRLIAANITTARCNSTPESGICHNAEKVPLSGLLSGNPSLRVLEVRNHLLSDHLKMTFPVFARATDAENDMPGPRVDVFLELFDTVLDGS